MRALSLAIVGAAYDNKRGPRRRFELTLCTPGEPVDLRPEPRNPKDPRAIAVFSCRDVQLGYLTAERAPWIGGMLAAGREMRCVFQAQTSWGGWIRCGLDGEEPVLPEAHQSEPHESAEIAPERDWWPDETYPDE